MNIVNIAERGDPIVITETEPGSNPDPMALRWDPAWVRGKWQHVMFQLNYVCGAKDLTLSSVHYFKTDERWSLPADAEIMSGVFASIMWAAHQAKEKDLQGRGVENVHTYATIHQWVQAALKDWEYP